ncbi:MAG: GumC family protein [Acidobacteriota bacterium]
MMTSQPEKTAKHREVNVIDYWRVIWSGKWTIAAILLVVVATVAVATFMQRPVYRAVARVEISPRPKSIAPGSDFTNLGAGWGWMAEERYQNTQIEIIQSRDIAARVVAQLGMDQDPAYSNVEDLVGFLQHRVEVEAVPETDIVEISIEDTDPERVPRLVNAVAHAYVDRNVELAAANTAKTLNELLQQVRPIRDKIVKNERALLGLARKNKLYVPESQTKTMVEQISQIQQKLTNTQIARGNLESVFQEISRIEEAGGSYETLPVVASDATIQELNTDATRVAKELERLSVSYLDRHPKVLKARSELDEIHRKIGTEVDKIISKIKTEYSIALQDEQRLIAQLEKAQEESLDLSVASTDYRILKSEIEEDRRIYDLVLSRVKEIDLNKQTLSNNLRVLDEAIVPSGPIRPKKALNLLAGCLLGLMMGTGTVIFMDYVDNTIKSAEDVEQFLQLPVLSVVPRFKKQMNPSVREAYRTLRTSLLFSSKARSLNTLLLTSAAPGEGKTSTAASLARTLASAGDRVVIVDADLRRPNLHNQFGVERSSGLTNYLMSAERDQAWARYLKKVENASNLSVITCGPIPPNPPELFSTDKFIDLVSQLKSNFDWVIIDSPPVASLSDSIVLGSLVDMVILVVKHNENDRDLIKRASTGLRKVGANVIGAVLNNVDVSKASSKDYYYAGYYYYGRDVDEDEDTAGSPVGSVSEG